MATDTALAERQPPRISGTAPIVGAADRAAARLEVVRGHERRLAVTILDDINLEVREGEMLALLGQSGSGKSTILRLMAGLTEPTQGAVLSHGAPLTGVNRGLAIVFQSFALYPWLTVQENVQVGLDPAPPRSRRRRRRKSTARSN